MSLCENLVWVDPKELRTSPPFSDLFPIRKDVRERIAESMKAGYDASRPINVWRGQNLVVDGHTRRLCGLDLGIKLLDAKHRSTLCVKTGKSFTFLIIFGVPDSSFIAMDLVAKRSGSDTLRMSQHKNAPALAAAAGWVFRWNVEDLLTNYVLTPSEVDEIVDAYPELIQSVEIGVKLKPLGAGVAFPSFCHFLFSQIDKDGADRFFARIATDVGHEDRSAVLALRRTLISRAKQLSNRQKIVSFFKAWNLYRQDKKADMIRALPDEAIPKLV